MKLSIVIPCYGSENTLESVVKETTETLKQRTMDYEIFLVNDSSPDCVWDVICRLAKENDKITGINLAKNFGQHSALMAGYRACTGDYVLSLDDDGQTPADELFSLVDKLEEGYDVVYATYDNKQHSSFRNIGSKVNDFMSEKLLGKPKGLKVSSYFIARKFIMEEVCQYQNPYCYILGLVLRTTNNIGTVSVHHRSRMEGRSGYTIGKLIKLWMNGFTAFSVKPLRMASLLGIVFALIGFLYLAYILINKIINPAVPIGWSSMISTTLLIGGVILFTLGMIGEYLGRVYISINDAPQYVIRETTDEKE